jgi:hypothetical protein
MCSAGKSVWDSTLGGLKVASSWVVDKRWSDQYSRYIRAVLGQEFITPSSDFRDMHEACDFDMVFEMRSLKFACRLRRSGYAKGFPFDVTLRYSRPNGTETEWAKVIDKGFADYMFYGFADPEPPRVSRWIIVNLELLRFAHDLIPFKDMFNYDNSSDFRVLSAHDLRSAGCVKAVSAGYWENY